MLAEVHFVIVVLVRSVPPPAGCLQRTSVKFGFIWLVVYLQGSAARCIVPQGYRPIGVISVRLVVLVIVLGVFFGVFLFFFNPIALIVSTAACQMSRILRYIHRT